MEQARVIIRKNLLVELLNVWAFVGTIGTAALSDAIRRRIFVSWSSWCRHFGGFDLGLLLLCRLGLGLDCGVLSCRCSHCEESTRSDELGFEEFVCTVS